MQSAADEIGRVRTIPTITDTMIPIKKGAFSVALIIIAPRRFIKAPMYGPTKFAMKTPTKTVTAGVIIMSIFVFLLTSFPNSTAKIVAI